MARTPYWLIQGSIIIDLLVIPVVIVFGCGIYLHWKKIMAGEARFRFSITKLQNGLKCFHWAAFWRDAVLAVRLYRKPVSGFVHGMVFWGMLLLFVGTSLIFFNLLFGLPVFSGAFYQWFMAFGLDAAGLAVLIGLLFLLVRRLLGYKRIAEPKQRRGFIPMELLLLAIIVSGFAVEILRIHLAGVEENAFIGSGLTFLLNGFSGATATYIGLWWCHGLLALAFIAYIPFSPMAHLLFIPLNAGLPEPLSGADATVLDDSAFAPGPEDELPTLGTPSLNDYSARRRLDLSTCVWCGRCQEVCPATLSEKDLNPKGVVTTLAEFLQANRSADSGLIEAIGMETLFECRTCAACVETCPALVNPLKLIMGMRQNLMMEQGEMPSQMRQAYRNFDSVMHPFSTSAASDDWRRGLDVPQFESGKTEYLLWIGCAVTYEDRAQQIGRSMVNLLNKAKISYGIIEEARCTGDPAKQMGDDYLFSMLAGTNIQLFGDYGVQKIITMCPHCFNSFKNYYPPLGGHYQVLSHADMLGELIRSGKLELKYADQRICYHDPCYLGRHNRIFDTPREVLGAMGRIFETVRHGSNSFCCGAGGGNYWNEEKGRRINYLRAEEMFNNGADKIASACPFCLLMLTDGLKMFSDKQVLFDIAELVEQNLEA